mmetsp:Transcript_39348/g.60148  ORF Transcript_39348/g.60148 Transcript_39348/m.60148 type:complete len:153 (+) Transcript_39348:362-820(+)
MGAVAGSTVENVIYSAVDTQPSFEFVKKLDLPENRGCDKCGISKLPFRSKHCRDCNRCVRKYDHHCFWVGGCVGELNHRKFYGFIFLQTLIFVWDLHFALSSYFSRFEDFKRDRKQANHVGSVWIFFVIFCVIFLMLTGGLAFYHSFLLCTG